MSTIPSQSAQSVTNVPLVVALPPLEPGERLTMDEFMIRLEALPKGIKAELIHGIVYMDTMTPFQQITDPPEIRPLQFGDHVTMEEFEESFNAMPNLKRAELINGKVYMNAAVSWAHGEGHGWVSYWLQTYALHTAGTSSAQDASDRITPGIMVQPDILLRIEPRQGGGTKVDHKGILTGPPELVAEVALTSRSYDLGEKFRVYQDCGVPEYVVLRVGDGEVDWFRLVNGKYERLMPDADGIIRSVMFPGLWLDPVALAAGNMKRVLAVLQLGLATPEHQAFVEKLNG